MTFWSPVVLSAIVSTPLLRDAKNVLLLETNQGTGGWHQANGKGGGLHRDQLALTHHENHDLGPHLWGSTRADARKPHANAKLAPHERSVSSSKPPQPQQEGSVLTRHSQKSWVPPVAAPSRAFQGPLLFLWAFVTLCNHLLSEDRGMDNHFTPLSLCLLIQKMGN